MNNHTPWVLLCADVSTAAQESISHNFVPLNGLNMFKYKRELAIAHHTLKALIHRYVLGVGVYRSYDCPRGRKVTLEDMGKSDNRTDSLWRRLISIRVTVIKMKKPYLYNGNSYNDDMSLRWITLNHIKYNKARTECMILLTYCMFEPVTWTMIYQTFLWGKWNIPG